MRNNNYQVQNNSNFQIAHLTQEEKAAVDKAQQEIKSKTGKDLVLIAWDEELKH